MAKITYTNKETLNSQPSIAAKNKVTSDDMNEIKQVVNENDNNVGDLAGLNTTDKSSMVNAINTLCPIVLYTDETGGTGTIQLNEDISHFKYYEIFYSRGTLGASSVKMPTTNLTSIDLTIVSWASSINRIYTSNVSLSGTTITRNYTRYVNIPDSGSINTGADNINIFLVLGYK